MQISFRFSLSHLKFLFNFHKLGFGAKLPPTDQIHHRFPLNGNPTFPYCIGVDDILNHYRQRLKSVNLCGPSNFSPVINSMISIAKQYQDGRHYFILLIITDGQISDFNETKRAIIRASSLPISIIIVGVGNAAFDNMDELDSDDTLLTTGDRCAERDIVQFVPMRKFLSNSETNQYIKSQSDLAKEVLAEIPFQLTNYFETHGIKPQTQNTSLYPSLFVPTAPIS